ncbi:MAG: hypothetical protein HOM58_19245 [Rhodospirillaceae bacterium]|jgi:hypothetical protein|nr:hypothetical protein [Rhodospirillaceae bacterium]MBT5459655.1 hypothetical protein [Rhodospirillaceae bacterium]
MSLAASLTSAPGAGWLRSARFDLIFIIGTTTLALAVGWLVTFDSLLFNVVFILNLWLLGKHHVVSTFTRLCFCKADIARHRFLLIQLPFIVLAGVLAVGFGIGWWALGTIYFYWQWFHYSRQSWGVSQFYRRQAQGRADENELATKLAFYLPPLWGILHRSWQAPETFLRLEFKTLPVPGMLVDVVGVAAVAALSWWVVLRLLAWRRGDTALAHTLFMASHHLIFLTGYLLIPDVTHGWLVLNIWHNAQYILFVWLQNNNRFKDGIDSSARFLSRLSQPGNGATYFGVCVLISTIAYGVIATTGVMVGDIGLPVLVLVYQTINFHHYIVDGTIWHSKKRASAPAAPANTG